MGSGLLSSFGDHTTPTLLRGARTCAYLRVRVRVCRVRVCRVRACAAHPARP